MRMKLNFVPYHPKDRFGLKSQLLIQNFQKFKSLVKIKFLVNYSW